MKNISLNLRSLSLNLKIYRSFREFIAQSDVLSLNPVSLPSRLVETTKYMPHQVMGRTTKIKSAVGGRNCIFGRTFLESIHLFTSNPNELNYELCLPCRIIRKLRIGNETKFYWEIMKNIHYCF